MSSNSASAQQVSGDDCQKQLQRRDACYVKYGLDQDRGKRLPTNHKAAQKKCWIATLEAKRCLAFRECQAEALQYYGTLRDEDLTNEKPSKLLCASYDEAFCFGNPQLMNVDSDRTGRREVLFAHHQKALRKTRNDRQKFKLCQEISNRMHNCIRKQTHIDWGEAHPSG